MTRSRDLANLADSTEFTAADHSKLDGIEASATADQTNAQIKTAVQAGADIALGGNPTTTTQSAGNNTTRVATTAFTQAAITALVGSVPATLNTLAELGDALGDDPNYATTTSNLIGTKMPLAGGAFVGNVTFGDNNKAIFGAGSDLQIYHAGSNSYVADEGAGLLILKTNGNAISLQKGDTETMALFAVDGAATLYHNNAAKIATSATGVTVTGAATLSSGQLNFAGSISDPNGAAYIWRPADNTLAFGTANEERMRISSTGAVGLSTTPAAWNTGTSGRTPLQFGFGSVSGRLNDLQSEVSNNAYAVGTGNDPQWAGMTRWAKSQIEFNSNGGLEFKSSPVVSTSAFASSPNLTWTNNMEITVAGNVGIGTSPESTIKTDIYSAALTSPMRLRFVDDNNGSSINPLSMEYKAGLEVENAYSGATPSANGTKVAKIQLTTVTSSGYSAGGSMMVSAQGAGYDAGSLSFNTGTNSSGLETERMRITSTGGVQTPYNPAFRARANTVNNLGTAWQKVTYTLTVTSRNATGSTAYDSSRFTSKVAGWYFFSASYTATANSDNDGTLALTINGSFTNLVSSASFPSTSGHSYNPHFCSGAVYLAYGDYVEVFRYSSVTTNTRTSNPYGGWFSGALIG